MSNEQHDLIDEMGDLLEDGWGDFGICALISPLVILVIALDTDEPHRDRVFFASWGSAMCSSFSFGALFLDDAAYRFSASVAQATATAFANAQAAIAARPLAVPTGFALLSVVGFAWSAVLYSRERGEGE